MKERLFLNGVNAKPGGPSVGGENNFLSKILPYKAEPPLTFF